MFLKIDNDCLLKFENIEFIEKRNMVDIMIFLDKHIGKIVRFNTELERNTAFGKISSFLNAKDFNQFIDEIEIT